MKKVISTLTLAFIALWSATANAQSATFTKFKANKAEGVSYTLRVEKWNSKDSATASVYYALNQSFSQKWLLKKYRFKDSLFIQADSLVGATYHMPAPPQVIYLMSVVTDDSARWTPISTSAQKVQLIAKPAKPRMLVVTKPVATQYGPVTKLSLKSNVPCTLQKFMVFGTKTSDSLRTINDGLAQEVYYSSINATINDTLLDMTQPGYNAYRLINEVGDTFTAIMKISQFITNAGPWSNITSVAWSGTKWSIDGEVVGNNLATTGVLNYLEPGATKWKQLSMINFIGQGIEKFHYDLTTTVQGVWQFKMATKNLIGVDTSGTISNTNQSPTVAFSVTNGNVTYLSPGKIKATGNLTLSSGNTAKLTVMIANDTLFKTVQVSQEVLFTASGPIEIIFDGILDKGQKYVTFRGYDTKSNTWVDRVRPYSKVYISNAADVKPVVVIKEGVKVYPNPTTASEGFTVSCTNNKTETLTMFNSLGQVVHEQIVSNGDVVKPELSADLYSYRFGQTTGHILFR